MMRFKSTLLLFCLTPLGLFAFGYEVGYTVGTFYPGQNNVFYHPGQIEIGSESGDTMLACPGFGVMSGSKVSFRSSVRQNPSQGRMSVLAPNIEIASENTKVPNGGGKTYGDFFAGPDNYAQGLNHSGVYFMATENLTIPESFRTSGKQLGILRTGPVVAKQPPSIATVNPSTNTISGFTGRETIKSTLDRTNPPPNTEVFVQDGDNSFEAVVLSVNISATSTDELFPNSEGD